MQIARERKIWRKIYIPCLFIYNVVVARKTRESEKNRRRSYRREEKVLIRKRREFWRGKVSCCLLVFVAKFQVAKQARFCCLLCCSKTSYLCTHNTSHNTLPKRCHITLRLLYFFILFSSFRILFLNRSIILHFPFFILTLLFK
jgi:hypothetical protein